MSLQHDLQKAVDAHGGKSIGLHEMKEVLAKHQTPEQKPAKKLAESKTKPVMKKKKVVA
jgi:hypothetical protein